MSDVKLDQRQLEIALIAAIKAGRRVLIKGEPGIGKTQIVQRAAALTGRRLVTMHPAVSDPTDYKGLPFVVDGRAEFLPIGELGEVMDASTPTVAFLDDLGQASVSVQAAVMHMADRTATNKHVVLLAATNERTHRAGVVGLLEPVKSRFDAIVALTVSYAAWKRWALDHDIDYRVLGYLEQHQEALHVFEPSLDVANQPSPRTWAAASGILQMELEDADVRFALLCGAVGVAAGTGFSAWLKIAEAAPTRDEIVSDPGGTRIPEQPDALYAVVSSLARSITKAEFAAVARYAQRMYDAGHGEMCSLLIRDIVRRLPDVVRLPAFAALAKSPLASLVMEAARVQPQKT